MIYLFGSIRMQKKSSSIPRWRGLRPSSKKIRLSQNCHVVPSFSYYFFRDFFFVLGIGE